MSDGAGTEPIGRRWIGILELRRSSAEGYEGLSWSVWVEAKILTRHW